jgi:hypothetical protein
MGQGLDYFPIKWAMSTKLSCFRKVLRFCLGSGFVKPSAIIWEVDTQLILIFPSWSGLVNFKLTPSSIRRDGDNVMVSFRVARG